MSKNPLQAHIPLLEINSSALKQEQKKYNLISLIRLFVFIGFSGGSLYSIFNLKSVILAVITALFLITFIILVKISVRLNSKIEFLKKVVLLYENEINIINGESNINSNGLEFVDAKHPYSVDLDIFGKNSIFHNFNRTCTAGGYQSLANRFINQCLSGKEIQTNQLCIDELSKDLKWCIHFLAYGLLNKSTKKSNSIENVLGWIKKKGTTSVLTSKTKQLLLFVPFLNCLFVFLIFYFDLPYLFVALPLLWNSILTWRHRANVKAYHKNISKSAHQLKTISKLCNYLESKIFVSDKLCSLQSKLKNEQTTASAEIKKLEQIANQFDMRLNFITVAVLNVFLLWDIRCLYKSDEWKEKNASAIESWLAIIAEFDALISIAIYNHNNTEFVTPKIAEQTVLFAKEMSHPLISSVKRVYNDFELPSLGTISIITGANMAGKSTFLRTIGANLVLAMIGSKVCAGEFIFKPMCVYSSMRNTDSIETGDSYFYAEIKRLQVLISKLNAGIEHFILLDEILKGTNSLDKLKGSQLFIQKLLSANGKATGLIATHDIALTDMITTFPKNIQNHCFECSIIGKKIRCDYKITKGVTKNMNALLLMEELEII